MASAASLPANLHRHVVTDTLGLLVVVLVTAASVQDRDGGRGVLARAKMAMPSITLVWADGGYAGKLVAWIRQLVLGSTRYRKAQIDQRGREAASFWTTRRSWPSRSATGKLPPAHPRGAGRIGTHRAPARRGFAAYRWAAAR